MSVKIKNEISIRSSTAEYLTFIAAAGESEQSVEMRYEDENIWLTQKMMAALYDITVSAINQHIKKIFEDEELEPDSVINSTFALNKSPCALAKSGLRFHQEGCVTFLGALKQSVFQ